MTREVRTTLEVKDILAVEYESSHCHAHITIPLEHFDRVLHQCPNCNEKLASPAGYGTSRSDDRSDEAVLSRLVDALKRASELSCKIRLQVANDVPPEASYFDSSSSRSFDKDLSASCAPR
jgi:hypothetical protein